MRAASRGSTSCFTVLALVAAGSGCASLSRGAYLEPYGGPTRAGLLELGWRRSMIEPAGVDFRPTYRGTPAYDATRDVVFVGSTDNGLYALRARDGAVIWRFETLGRVDSSPLVYDGAVYFGSADGALYAADAETGAMRWRVGTPAAVTHQPIAIDDTIYFVNANDTVLGIARGDGSVRWRYRRPAPGGISLAGHAGLARRGQRLYTGFADGNVVCLDARDGSVLWEQDTSADLENVDEATEGHRAIDVDTTPVVIGDTVFAASFSAGVFGLDAVGGGQRLRMADVTGVSGLTGDGRYLYAASSTLGLIKIDPQEGNVVWARNLESPSIVGAEPFGDGLLAVSTGNHGLWVVRAADGEPIEAIEPSGGFTALPLLTQRRLFVESNNGIMYSFWVRRSPRAAVPPAVAATR